MSENTWSRSFKELAITRAQTEGKPGAILRERWLEFGGRGMTGGLPRNATQHLGGHRYNTRECSF